MVGWLGIFFKEGLAYFSLSPAGLRGGGDSKVQNLSADSRVFFASMLPVGVGKNKNSRGRKKIGHHGPFSGVSREKLLASKFLI